MALEWPYNLPIWRDSFRAASPDGRFAAEIDPACEVSMSDPTSGILCIPGLLHIEHCNPSFIWSSDSRYLAVPRFFARFGLLQRQRLLLVDVLVRRVYASKETACYFQPESFVEGRLVVTKEPFRKAQTIAWQIPDEIGDKFAKFWALWSRSASVPSAP
jgi:hypothetical protein